MALLPLLIGCEVVGTDLHVNYLVRLEREDGGGEGARGVGGGGGGRGLRSFFQNVRGGGGRGGGRGGCGGGGGGGATSYPFSFPERAGRAREVRWGAGVDAALVVGTGGRPGAGSGVVAALFDGGGGALGTGG